MGLKLQRQVLRSALPRYRFLAVLLALYADDDGRNIYRVTRIANWAVREGAVAYISKAGSPA